MNGQASTGEILGTPQLIFSPVDENNCAESKCDKPVVVACPDDCRPRLAPGVIDGIGGSSVSKTLERVYWINNE